MAKHISKGRLPGLRADQLNELTETVLSGSSTGGGDPAPPAPPKTALLSGQFPIFATLGPLIEPVKEEEEEEGEGGQEPFYRSGDDSGDDDDDREGDDDDLQTYGYKWTQVTYSRSEHGWNSGQADLGYTKVQNNPAYGVGISGTDLSRYPIFEGQGVLLYPANDQDGNPILVFQPPEGFARVFPARITGWNEPVDEEGMAIGGEDPCEELIVSTYNFRAEKMQGLNADGLPVFISDPDIEPGIAVNLSDMNGGRYGGSINTSDGVCPPSTTPVKIRNNCRVMMHYLGTHSSKDDKGETETTKMYGFFVKNDFCVECCVEEGIRRPKVGTEARTALVNARRINKEFLR